MTALKRMVPLFVLITCLTGLIYLVAQQNLRLTANDPQIQMAEDTAAKLTTDQDTVQVTSLPRIDMRQSLAPFIITFDATGKVVSSSGEIAGQVPTPPQGVFAYAKEHEEDRFTWEPQTGVRIAAVVRQYNGRTSGYVLAGRSLEEVEKREDILFQQVGLAWVVTIVLTMLAVLITPLKSKK
ncbi:MAG TPA: hypothetical protein VG935_00895 [Patescibacteria group bacterium]|nr:hypothetical protein [Patescibacteria group bacterium]